MATTFLDLIVVLLWPLALSAAAWVIAINALAETDEISKVVEALTRPNGAEENAKRGEVSLRRSNLSAIARGDGGWFQVHFRGTRHKGPTYQLRKAER
jgi:hypothetical protein